MHPDPLALTTGRPGVFLLILLDSVQEVEARGGQFDIEVRHEDPPTTSTPSPDVSGSDDLLALQGRRESSTLHNAPLIEPLVGTTSQPAIVEPSLPGEQETIRKMSDLRKQLHMEARRLKVLQHSKKRDHTGTDNTGRSKHEFQQTSNMPGNQFSRVVV